MTPLEAFYLVYRDLAARGAGAGRGCRLGALCRPPVPETARIWTAVAGRGADTGGAGGLTPSTFWADCPDITDSVGVRPGRGGGLPELG